MSPVLVAVVLSKELEALGLHGSFPWYPAPASVRPCSPARPPKLHRKGKRSALSEQPPGFVPFSWVCSWPFTQVTCTCCIVVIMAPRPTLPPKREPQQCVPRVPCLSFHPSQECLDWCWEAHFTHCLFKNCTHQDQPSCLPSPEASQAFSGTVCKEEGVPGSWADS